MMGAASGWRLSFAGKPALFGKKTAAARGSTSLVVWSVSARSLAQAPGCSLVPAPTNGGRCAHQPLRATCVGVGDPRGNASSAVHGGAWRGSQWNSILPALLPSPGQDRTHPVRSDSARSGRTPGAGWLAVLGCRRRSSRTLPWPLGFQARSYLQDASGVSCARSGAPRPKHMGLFWPSNPRSPILFCWRAKPSCP